MILMRTFYLGFRRYLLGAGLLVTRALYDKSSRRRQFSGNPVNLDPGVP